MAFPLTIVKQQSGRRGNGLSRHGTHGHVGRLMVMATNSRDGPFHILYPDISLFANFGNMRPGSLCDMTA